jgi:hypothetical protein
MFRVRLNDTCSNLTGEVYEFRETTMIVMKKILCIHVQNMSNNDNFRVISNFELKSISYRFFNIYGFRFFDDKHMI